MVFMLLFANNIISNLFTVYDNMIIMTLYNGRVPRLANNINIIIVEFLAIH